MSEFRIRFLVGTDGCPVADFRDTDGTVCTIKVNPGGDLWIGMDGPSDIYLDRSHARELARLLARFAETGSLEEEVADGLADQVD